MTVTLMGDSLTAGNLGIPYRRYLRLPPEWRLVNRGKDGDTLRGVLSRIGEALAADAPNIVVLEIGANDILLPEMAARGGRWGPFTENMIASGAVPTQNPDDFENLYARLVRIAGSAGPERVVAATIPPVGEDLGSGRNKIREEFNRRIRRAVGAIGAAVAPGTDGGPTVLLADAAAVFEEALREKSASSGHFFGEPEDFAADARRLSRGKSAAALSEERGLHLTMDGAHLNERGARLFAEALSEALGG